NHCTTMPTIDRRRIRKGMPSRRSSLLNRSGPKARAVPPARWARPSHILTKTFSGVSAAGYATVFVAGSLVVFAVAVFAGVVLVVALVALEFPPRADVPRPRLDDLLVVAMVPRYFGPATLPRIDPGQSGPGVS